LIPGVGAVGPLTVDSATDPAGASTAVVSWVLTRLPPLDPAKVINVAQFGTRGDGATRNRRRSRRLSTPQNQDNYGISGLASNGSKFVNVTLSGNVFSNCKVATDLDGAPGVTITP
jgi:hypothetical protein